MRSDPLSERLACAKSWGVGVFRGEERDSGNVSAHPKQQAKWMGLSSTKAKRGLGATSLVSQTGGPQAHGHIEL